MALSGDEQNDTGAAKDYRDMTDQQKDVEVARSIIRLQEKIQKILYHSEIEWARTVDEWEHKDDRDGEKS